MAKNENEKTENLSEEAAAQAPAADDRVEVFIPRGHAGEDPNLFVSINGVNYLLPRGQTSRVPRYVAEEIKRAERAQERMDRRIDEMLEASK